MKKTIFKTVLILFTVSLLFTSCNKDEDPVATKTELLTAAKWHGETQKVYTNNTLTNTVDVTNQDLELFTNHEYKAYTDNVVDTEGVWALSADEESITLFGGATFTINELTSSKFVFTLHTTIGGNQTDVKYTYSK